GGPGAGFGGRPAAREHPAAPPTDHAEPARSRGVARVVGEAGGNRDSLPHLGSIDGRMQAMSVIDCLLDSDPAIRWQVMRDLTHAPADVVAAERSRVATEGWGARLLELQAPEGLWAGMAFSQERTDTFHVLELLRRLGLDPASEQAQRALGLVREHVTWGAGAWWNPTRAQSRYFEGEVEPCINGNVVSTGSYFGVDMGPLVERLLGEQLPDGGWNCAGEEHGHTV